MLLLANAKWDEAISFRQFHGRVFLNRLGAKGDVLVQMAPVSPDVLPFMAPGGVAAPFQGSASTKRGMELEVPTGVLSRQLEQLDAFLLSKAIEQKWFGWASEDLTSSYHPLYKQPVDGADVGTLRTKVTQTTNIYRHRVFDEEKKSVAVELATIADVKPFVGVIPIFKLGHPWHFPARGDKPPIFGISLDVTDLYMQPTEFSAAGIGAFSL